MTKSRSHRLTLKEWLAKNARQQAKHLSEIAEALDREASSVSASLSIEKKQAREENRPPYFVREGSGLYRYNDLCEGAIDESLIIEVRDRAREFNLATRREMKQSIAKLDDAGFEKLARIVLANIRARYKDIEVIRRYNDTVVLRTSWLDDGGRSPVVVFAKRCDVNEQIGREVIMEVRGALPILQANQGVLITNGVVSKEGRDEAVGYTENDQKVSVPPVHIMDIEIILNVLFESRTAVKIRNVEVFILDTDFFDNLTSED